ncbi:MAG: tripartite tricarboxylate transporter substrate binding protein, partial [Reyranella sp.]|nr:tripartite tricarboxylate transporter substrate binding protein [Reyranella sp.]
MKRSTFVAAALAAFVLPVCAFAQSDYPTKAITFVVPYPAGGLNDAIVRVIGERMSAELGKPVLIDNKAGAATTLASNFVAKAPADGYTLYGGGTSLIINPTLQGNVQYDPHKSFDLVSLISFTPFILQVNADFPVKTMAELIAYLKANPGKFNMATSGIGATNHMAAELFRAKTGLQYTIVPYRGGAQAGQDLAAGNAQMMFSASLEAIPFLQSGRTRAIAISSLKRSPSFPEIPTVDESTEPKELDAGSWAGRGGRAGT